MYKVAHALTASTVSSLFLQSSNNRHARPQSNFSMAQVSTLYFGQNTIRYLGLVLWNSIPTEKLENFEKH